jgi:hypothetical protein
MIADDRDVGPARVLRYAATRTDDGAIPVERMQDHIGIWSKMTRRRPCWFERQR